MSLILRETTEKDLSFVLETEKAASKDGVVNLQTWQNHKEYLANKNTRHLIIETKGTSVGYLILAGLEDKNETIEFRRIVVSEKGKGFGRQALRLAKQIAFEELNAHRFWLDVVDTNKRARKLYESEGFITEGKWRECYKVKGKNERESLVFMSILKDEYRKNE